MKRKRFEGVDELILLWHLPWLNDLSWYHPASKFHNLVLVWELSDDNYEHAIVKMKIFNLIEAFTSVGPSSPGSVSMSDPPTNKFSNWGELWRNHEHENRSKNPIRESRINSLNWEEHPYYFLTKWWGDTTVIVLSKFLMSWWSKLWCAKDNLISGNFLKVENHSEYNSQRQWKAKQQMQCLWWIAALALLVFKVAFSGL